MKMDMRKYSGSVFRKVEDPDLREGRPVQVAITAVSEGKFEKPVLTFDDNTQLTINATNNRALMRAFGAESDLWLGRTVELVLGEVEYNGKTQISIVIQPLSLPITNKAAKSGLNDNIPF
jgi:hypothetical protein